MSVIRGNGSKLSVAREKVDIVRGGQQQPWWQTDQRPLPLLQRHVSRQEALQILSDEEHIGNVRAVRRHNDRDEADALSMRPKRSADCAGVVELIGLTSSSRARTGNFLDKLGALQLSVSLVHIGVGERERNERLRRGGWSLVIAFFVVVFLDADFGARDGFAVSVF